MKPSASPGRKAGRAPGLKDGLYKAAFDQARDSMLLVEFTGGGAPVIRAANAAALRLHGYGPGGLVGEPITVLGASPGAGRFGRGNDYFEVKQRRRDGTELVTEASARTLAFGGRHYGVLVERDVTGRRKLEREGRLAAGRIMLARESEKKRLAAVLHDSIGSLHVGLSACLLLAEEEMLRGGTRGAAAGVARAREILNATASDIKTACVETWPPALGVSGLKGALTGLLAEFKKRSGIRVRRSIALPPGVEKAESHLSIIIYRLAQEILRNAERHSGARSLEFSVGRSAGGVTLSVADDGRGFDPAAARAKRTSLGLRIMEEATESVGGFLHVYSGPAGGTRIKAELPLAPERSGGL